MGGGAEIKQILRDYGLAALATHFVGQSSLIPKPRRAQLPVISDVSSEEMLVDVKEVGEV